MDSKEGNMLRYLTTLSENPGYTSNLMLYFLCYSMSQPMVDIDNSQIVPFSLKPICQVRQTVSKHKGTFLTARAYSTTYSFCKNGWMMGSKKGQQHDEGEGGLPMSKYAIQALAVGGFPSNINLYLYSVCYNQNCF